MTFLLTTADETGQVRDFIAHLNELEKGFDLVNDVMAMGHSLLRVHLLDQGKAIHLPTDVFTGESFSAAFQQLEQEWQAILLTPASNHQAASRAYRLAIQRQLVRCEEGIVSCELLISRFTLLFEGMQLAGRGTGHSGRLSQHYEAIMITCNRQIDRTYCLRYQLQQRLDQLNQQT